MQWLQYVVKNRRGETSDEVVDMHVGPVTDDKMKQLQNSMLLNSMIYLNRKIQNFDGKADCRTISALQRV